MHEDDRIRPVEAELKLTVPPGQGARLLEHPAFRAALASAPEERHEVTTYFDTPDLALARGSLSLRVRRTAGRRVQTLKANGTANSVVLRRGEWEWPIEQDQPDLGLLAQTPLDGASSGHIDGHLESVFVTDIRRTVCGLRLANGTQAEAAIDEGDIAMGDVRDPVSELELKAGAPGPLYHLALDLHAAVPLTVSAESKAERVARLRTGEAPAMHKAADPHLRHDATVADGVRRVVESCLGQFVANRATALAGSPEGVHQTRISMRRLRFALALFDEHLKRRASRRFDGRLQRLGRVLGEARNWDVFCLETLPAAAKGAPGKSWGGLRKAADAERRSAHRRLRAKLSGPAATGLVLELAAEAAAEPGVSALLKKSVRQPLAKEAPVMLDRLARKAAKRGRHLEAAVRTPGLEFSGGYAEASWVITGEPRRHIANEGTFDSPHPAQPFSLRTGSLGAFEAVARYSHTDLNDRVARGRSAASTGGVFGGVRDIYAADVNWYPDDHLRVMLDYDIVNVDRLNPAGTTQTGQQVQAVALRAQAAF